MTYLSTKFIFYFIILRVFLCIYGFKTLFLHQSHGPKFNVLIAIICQHKQKYFKVSAKKLFQGLPRKKLILVIMLIFALFIINF